jgi:ribosome-associated translation inhibitor RaiA
MQVPLQIVFQDMPVPPAVEAAIRERADALDRFFPDIVSCRVAVESSARRHRQGKLYRVRIAMTVPGHEVVVNRNPSEHHAHEEVLVAVRDAFDAARRQLEDYARRLRIDTKTHEPAPHGRISRLFPDHGFIQSSDGQEIYMHRNAVAVGKFDDLSAMKSGTTGTRGKARRVLRRAPSSPSASTTSIPGDRSAPFAAADSADRRSSHARNAGLPSPAWLSPFTGGRSRSLRRNDRASIIPLRDSRPVPESP